METPLKILPLLISNARSVHIWSLMLARLSASVTSILSRNAMPAMDRTRSVAGSANAGPTGTGVTYIDTAGPQISARKSPSGLEYALRMSVPQNLGLREHRPMRLCSQRTAREPRENFSRSMSGTLNPLLSSDILEFDLLELPLFASLLKGDSSTQAVNNRFVDAPTVAFDSIKHCQ